MLNICSPSQVVPILRAGLIPLEQASTVLPAMQTYHVGLVRDEKTLQVSGACGGCQCISSLPAHDTMAAMISMGVCAAADRVPQQAAQDPRP